MVDFSKNQLKCLKNISDRYLKKRMERARLGLGGLLEQPRSRLVSALVWGGRAENVGFESHLTGGNNRARTLTPGKQE